jgi:hypothetical protein
MRLMANVEQRNHAGAFLRKAKEYLASAEDNLAAERHTPAAGDAIHAGISAKDAIVIILTGSTSKGKDHATAAKELKQALGRRSEATTSEKALRELLSAKGEVEYGIALVSAARAESLLRRARILVELAIHVVTLGR